METRKEWLALMRKISYPVLDSLSRRKLHEELPFVFHPDRRPFGMLEAFGRTMCGIAPWLELSGLEGEEADLQREYRALAAACMDAATDPSSPDYMNFKEGYGQALVDAAFLAHAILRAPVSLYASLEERVQRQVCDALRATRVFTPYVSNWLFFSAMIEAALYRMGQPDYDMVRVEYAVRSFQNWYVGDGTYGDGASFHWDYYNSFVIHPMYVDILAVFSECRQDYREMYKTELARARRYARVLEELIAPDGSYPVIGRSVTYRFGAFQLLAQVALEEFLPQEVSPAQVRCGLTAVLRRVQAAGSLFDENGWLLPGICGYQPEMAEGYICVGSLYLCCAVFLPLGLSPAHPFWSAPDEPWTAKKIWSGCPEVVCDHAMDE